MMYADRCSTKEDHFDETEYFEADSAIKDGFIRETSVQNAFVSIMCKYYQRSVNHGKLPKPDFVKLAVQEALGDSASSYDWVHKSYIVYDKDKVLEDFEIQKGSRDVYRCNWDKVESYCVRFDILFERYKNDGGKDSTTKFGRELTKNNIAVCVPRKVKGKTMNYRVGIKIPEDEPDWF
jgi:hypothetical protein